MISPKARQLFPDLILSSKDGERLSVYLSSWTKLAKFLIRMNDRDIKRLIMMELSGKQRWKLLDRLIRRLGRIHRLEIERKVKLCLSPKPKSKQR